MQKKIPYLIIIFLLLVLIGKFTNDKTNKKSEIQPKSISWKLPDTSQFYAFGRLMISNGIKGCGEYYLKRIGSDEFMIACTKDGNNWDYYIASPKSDKINLVNEEMKKSLKAPR